MSPDPSLSIFPLIRRAYESVLSEPRRFLDVAWPWLGLSTFCLYALERLKDSSDDLSPEMGFLFILLVMAHLAALNGFLVKWTRWLLLGEMPVGRAIFGWGRREWRALLATFLAGLPLIPPILILAYAIALSAMNQESAATWGFVLPFVLVLGVFLWLRLSLAPALAALDASGNSLAASWRLTRKRTGRLLAIMILSILPLYGLEVMALYGFVQVMQLLGVEPQEMQGGAIQGAVIFVTIVINFVLLSLLMAAQALAMQEFRREDEANRPASGHPGPT
jgi:hypothetical protein